MGEQAGVLTAEAIRERCVTDSDGVREPLISEMADGNLRGAKYDIRMAVNGMVLPGGRVVKPVDPPHGSPVLLYPGETIFVSSREHFHVPLDLVGNMSIKGELSREGILSLTGLIVDPGYECGPSADGRLHFRLANLGARPVVLTPGESAIASIQFLALTGQAQAEPESFPDVWSHTEDYEQGLGFIEELRELRNTVKVLRRDFESQRRSVEYVVFGGIVLIMATLLGVAVAAILSLGADSRLVSSAKNVIPKDAEGQWLFVLGLFGLAAIASATVISLSFVHRPSRPHLSDVQRTRREAYRALTAARALRLSCAAVVIAVLSWLTVMGCQLLGLAVAVDVLVCVVVLVLGSGVVAAWLWKPITPLSIREQLVAWHQAESSG